jgi:hypothetical protein
LWLNFLQPSSEALASSFSRFLDHIRRATSLGLLWTSDRSVAETYTWQHTPLTTNIHAPGGIWTNNLSGRTAADLRLRPRGHWDRQERVTRVNNTTTHYRVRIIRQNKIIFHTPLWLLNGHSYKSDRSETKRRLPSV